MSVAGSATEASRPEDRTDIVVIGASAGGVEALGRLMAALDGRLRAALVIVLHIAPTATSVLPNVLERSSHLPAVHARDGQQLRPGQVVVAPPDHHVEVDGRRIRLSRGPKVNGVRPAIDPLFRSAARSFGARAMGMVLSGMLDDGTVGLSAIKQAGGVTAAQDPDEAAYPQMPSSAIAAGVADLVLPVERLADLIASATSSWEAPKADDRTPEPAASGADTSVASDPQVGDEVTGDEVTGISCPSCGGVLWERREGGVPDFRCRIGHTFSSVSLFDAQSDGLDLALWAAVRALEERAALGRRLAHRLRERGQARLALRYERVVDESGLQASVIKGVIARTHPHDDIEPPGDR